MASGESTEAAAAERAEEPSKRGDPGAKPATGQAGTYLTTPVHTETEMPKSAPHPYVQEGTATAGDDGGTPDRAEELKAEIERTRAEMGETAAALAAKLDVPGRVKQSAAETGAHLAKSAADTGTHLAKSAADTGTHLAKSAADTGTHLAKSAADTGTHLAKSAADTGTHLAKSAADTGTHLAKSAADTANRAGAALGSVPRRVSADPQRFAMIGAAVAAAAAGIVLIRRNRPRRR
ncbi:DUF3618 domain-containing protein [Actinoplanes sp. NBC_00393]|uniref:DUF3618 domain-containing protein n=1 Tax=Actinoplanes sp. NBC_00393 TaxID=2975953 RepID=UPI002E1E7C8F